jgi:hypothetical protein
MANTLTWILYTDSAIGMVGLLWRNTGNSMHLAEFHIGKPLNTYTALWGRLAASHERMQNDCVRRRWSGCSATKPKYKHTKNFQDDWYSTGTGIKNFAPWWFISVSPPRSAASLLGRSCQPCIIFLIVATTAAHSAWHSAHGWSLNYPWWYYQHEGFTHTKIHMRYEQNVIFCEHVEI